VYVPGIKPEESNRHIKMPDNDYALAFMRLINKESRNRFMDDYLFDIRPVSDEKPFFHYYLKIVNLQKTYRVMGEKWQYFIEEGFLLPVLLVQVLVVSLVLILLPLLKLKQHETTQAGQNPFQALSYFALLGIAYLFIEIALIQKMILGLENPSFAASTVIASVLICSGIGSMLSQVSRRSGTRVLLSCMVIAPAFRRRSSPSWAGFPANEDPLCHVSPGVLMGIPFGWYRAPHFPLIPGSSRNTFSMLVILAVAACAYSGYQLVLLRRHGLCAGLLADSKRMESVCNC
jgi:hypothetical protein